MPVIGAEAWVLDDTGFPKDGKRSPGVKRQYSGTLGKTGNCQIGVSVHAVGARGTVPLGWALYLPEDWCEDADRRRKAKIPEEVAFKTKSELGVELVERAAGWSVPKGPVLGDHAYGENTWLRDRFDEAGCEYVLCVGPKTKVFEQGTTFAVQEAGRVTCACSPAAGPSARARRRADRTPQDKCRSDGHLPRQSRRRPGHLHVHLRPCSRRARLARERGMDRVARALRGSTARGMADRRMARRTRRADRLLDLKPPRRHRPRTARAAGAIALEDRARLQATQRRTRAGSLRGAAGWGGITTRRW
jgi:hypothetical protein